MDFPTWQPELKSDVTANSSSKTFTVPADTYWKLSAVYVSLTTTATAGNRQLVVEVLGANNAVIAEIRAGAVQAASLTRKYLFASIFQDLTAFRDTDFLANPLPELALIGGQKLRIRDKAAVAAAADDMDVHLHVWARASGV